MESNYRTLQSENFQLREYILNLQSRLLESSSDIPPAPSHINLPAGGPSRAPMEAQEHRYQADGPQASAGRSGEPQDALSQLQAAAAQADAASRPHDSPYGLGAAGEYSAKRVRAGDGSADVKPL
jgi:hypothetical protein